MENITYFCIRNQTFLLAGRDETDSEELTIEKNAGVHLLSDSHSPYTERDVVFFE